VTARAAAAVGLAIWLAIGLLMTLQPIEPPPGLVVVPNLVPLRTLAIYMSNTDSPFWMGQLAGNLLLLLPLGLLGPIALPAMNGWLRVFSLAIEAAQLWIPNRMADVDDVLLNVVGALLGYAIFLVLGFGAGRRPALAERD
jgi:glycopeptide antibiotics resistance protein